MRWAHRVTSGTLTRASPRQIRSAGSGSETQLRVSWDSILNAEQTGRWWIVGSAWSGAPMIDSCHRAAPQQPLGTVGSPLLSSVPAPCRSAMLLLHGTI